MSSVTMLYCRDKQVRGNRFLLLRTFKLTVPGLVYASVVGLTGCASSSELESLRAEVAKANATAVRAEAEASRTRRELAALKAAAESPRAPSMPKTTSVAPSTKPSGYKWGKLPRY